MPEYLHPGVYVKEKASDAKPIEAASTSTACFVGTAVRGRPSFPTLITSWFQFKGIFDDLDKNHDLPLAVSQFFQNGGARAYIVRIVGEGANFARNVMQMRLANGGTSNVTIQAAGAGAWGEGITVTVTQTASDAKQAAQIARENALRGNGLAPPPIRFNLQVSIDDEVVETWTELSGNEDGEKFYASVINRSSSYIKIARGEDGEFVQGQPTFADGTAGAAEDAAKKANAASDAAKAAKAVSDAAAATSKAVAEASPAVKTAADAAAKAEAAAKASADATTAADAAKTAADAAKTAADAAKTAADAAKTAAAAAAGTPNEAAAKAAATKAQTEADAAAAKSTAAKTPSDDAKKKADDAKKTSDDAKKTADDAKKAADPLVDVAVKAVDPVKAMDADNAKALVRVAAAIKAAAAAMDAAAVDQAKSDADAIAASAKEAADAAENDAKTAAAEQDRAKKVANATAAEAKMTPLKPGQVVIKFSGTGGSDGGKPTANDYDDGFATLDRLSDVSLLVVPGVPADVAMKAASYVSERRTLAVGGDMFYIMDPPPGGAWQFGPHDARDPGKQIEAITKFCQTFSPKDTYSALYFPWVDIPDPYSNVSGTTRFAPPSGMIAGLFARTDNTRGVWKAPAGTEATLLGALGVAAQVTDQDQDSLNPIGVNCIRQFAASGVVCWGARTLGTLSDPEYRYVPVRRTANFLKVSLYRGTQWVVFEPNDEPLWKAIRFNVNAFMSSLFRAGAFQGTKSEDAFFVKCDKDNNTQATIDQGQVHILVGFAPLKPAEFVIIELQQIIKQ